MRRQQRLHARRFQRAGGQCAGLQLCVRQPLRQPRTAAGEWVGERVLCEGSVCGCLLADVGAARA